MGLEGFRRVLTEIDRQARALGSFSREEFPEASVGSIFVGAGYAWSAGQARRVGLKGPAS